MLKELLRKNEYRALLEFKRALAKKLEEELLDLKIFGSKARGDSKKDSDIDILIVLKGSSEAKEDFILDLTVDILLRYGLVISPHIYSQSQILKFKKIPSIFFQVLEREAVPL